jgi:DNA repair photolyase
MRWDSLRLDATQADGSPGSGAGAPALFEREAVARTFDTPGFRGMTFYEVHARSIINQVPPASRMAFRWTINPYRGCSHSCAYCLHGGTPILMADGSTRPLAYIRPGDAIYGTVRRGSCRHYVITEVLDHWSTIKAAYAVTLEDETRLISSADHRFLTDRGWKHVIGTEWGGPLRRPHLTLSSKLMGVGEFAEPPKQTADYRRGYLCGVIRGDAALTDAGALGRTRGYLGRDGKDPADQCLIEWPAWADPEWRKGFLAGIFDARGHQSQGVLRIASADPEIIGWTASSMKSLGFGVVVEHPDRPKGMKCVRLLGGLRAVLRFFHTTEPAITRKRSIEGMALKSDAPLRVASIEPIGMELELFDITTGTGDFIANGVVSHNCFARNTHTYLDMDSGHDFNSRIVVKVNAPQLARKELAAPKWQGEHVAMGTNVDCYQRAEGRYKLMPGIIEALRDTANPFSILTKGTLILRDLELLAEAAEVTDVGLNVSAGFVDKEISRSVEPGTPSPERRLGVCAALNERGLRCGVLMGPVLPFLTDSPAQLEQTVRLAAEAGAIHVTPIVLHLRPGAREWFLKWLGENFPDLLDAYRGMYGRSAYAPKAYQAQIAEQIRELARRYRVGRATPGQARRIQPRAPQPQRGSQPEPPPEPEPVQLSLL